MIASFLSQAQSDVQNDYPGIALEELGLLVGRHSLRDIAMTLTQALADCERYLQLIAHDYEEVAKWKAYGRIVLGSTSVALLKALPVDTVADAYSSSLEISKTGIVASALFYELHVTRLVMPDGCANAFLRSRLNDRGHEYAWDNYENDILLVSTYDD